MTPLPSPSNNIINLKDIIHSSQQIYKYIDKICNAYEHLISRYETLSLENVELKKSESVKAAEESCTPVNHGHKRRKTDESLINDSVASNDPLNEAIQDTSGYLDDEIIDSTPKPDISRKNVLKKNTTFKSPPNKRNPIKVENFDDSKDEARKTECDKKAESPLKSVENQCSAGKENQQKNHSKWISNSLQSPRRVTRHGFIIAKSPKGVSRMSLSRTYKQSTLDFTKKSTKETSIDTCVETFYDGTPHKQIAAPPKQQIDPPPKQMGDVKRKFLNQPSLESCIKSSKDSDDENMFTFKANVKPNTTSSISPPNIKLEPQTGRVKAPDISDTANSKVKIENNQTTSTCSSSVVALSGEKCEVIEIEDSIPLFDDCSETFCDRLELRDVDLKDAVNERRISENENFVANHIVVCRNCRLFMTSNPLLLMKDKLRMIDRCDKHPKKPDTDPEYWNPRFLPTPESQKQETLIDDRRATRKKKNLTTNK